MKVLKYDNAPFGTVANIKESKAVKTTVGWLYLDGLHRVEPDLLRENDGVVELAHVNGEPEAPVVSDDYPVNKNLVDAIILAKDQNERRNEYLGENEEKTVADFYRKAAEADQATQISTMLVVAYEEGLNKNA